MKDSSVRGPLSEKQVRALLRPPNKVKLPWPFERVPYKDLKPHAFVAGLLNAGIDHAEIARLVRKRYGSFPGWTIWGVPIC